jgi:tRNA nucleotidyltransferase (CCA-adding enzyme)
MRGRNGSTSVEVILTHENADFDAIASLQAASKLYPAAIPVLPRRVNRNVRAFLTLYGEELSLVGPEDLPRGSIERALLVDTQSLTTLKGMARGVEVQIIDHHERDRALPDDWVYSGEPIGAATTLLVEEISARSIKLTSIEATLLLLGIYEDTGSLSYAGTTHRDVRAAAWLLEMGANLAVANEFLHHPLAPGQRELYEALLEQTETHEIEGHAVIVAWADAQGLDEEISTIAHKLRDLLEPAALFVLVGLDGRVQLVARSTTDDIDVSRVAERFGGGGHARASAAPIRGRSLDEVRTELLGLLPQVVEPSTTVGEIMSRGVQVLSPQDTVAEAAERMKRTGHEGYPVVADGQVIGLLTRRAVDRALQFEMGDDPVSQVMQADNVTIGIDDSVPQLQQRMIETGWGQIPVVDGEQIVGVATRTDLMAVWGASAGTSRTREVATLMERALSEPALALVRLVSRTARAMGYVPYFVGGLVRDVLLGQPILDVDLVIEGDAIALADRLCSEVGGRAIPHRRFGTAKWLLSPEVWEAVSAVRAQEGLPPSIDFATARTEFYTHPTALPQVERSSIKQDLYRRDFTINTLAIRLDPERWGELLDFYGGEADLDSGVIRVLHSLSFVDDPTRMLRAARLESRLGFHLDPRSEQRLADALPLLRRVSGDRVRHELEQILAEAQPERALRRLSQLGVLEHIHPALVCDKWLEGKYRELRESFDWRAWQLRPDDDAFVHLALLLYRLEKEALLEVCKRLRVSRDGTEDLQLMVSLRSSLPPVGRARRPSTVYRLLEPYPRRVLAVGWVATGRKRARDHLLRYQTEWRLVKSDLTGDELKGMGLKPGPMFGDLLAELRDARLDGKVSTREEEQEMLRGLVDSRRARSR